MSDYRNAIVNATREIQKFIYSCENAKCQILNPCIKTNFIEFEKILNEICPDAKIIDGIDGDAYTIVFWMDENAAFSDISESLTVGHISDDGCLSLDDGIHFYPGGTGDYKRFAKIVKIAIDDEKQYEEIMRNNEHVSVDERIKQLLRNN